MFITCLDLEGTLAPEIWVTFAEKTGIEGLKVTTRDEPDYDVLMKYRLDLVNKHGYGIKEIQEVIETMDLLPGAKEFLDELRSFCQVVIISDTFQEFAMPIMKKLGYPTILCNSLVIDEDGKINDYKLRITDTKTNTVKALQSMGYQTLASGDSYNDLGMIKASNNGWLFCPPQNIIDENPDVGVVYNYEELMAKLKKEILG